jgi:hypothetical protein
MTYRELLEKCKKYPNFCAYNEEHRVLSEYKYQEWVRNQNELYGNRNTQNNETYYSREI